MPHSAMQDEKTCLQKIFRGRPNISVGQPILVQLKYTQPRYCYCTLKVQPRG